MTNKVFERDEIKDKFKSSLSDINQLYDEYIINLRESNDSKKLYQIYEKLDDENIFFSEFKEKIDNERAKELHENNLALFTKIGEFMMQQSLKTQFIKDMEKDLTTIALENHEKLNSYIEMKTSKEKRDAYQDFKSHIGQHYDTDCQLNKFLDKLLSRLTEEQPHKLYEMHKNLHGNITDQKLYLNVKNHIEKYCEELVHNDEKKHDKAREDLGKTHNFLDKLKDTSSHDEVQRSMKLTTEIPIDLNSKFRTYKETKVSSNIAGNPIDNLGKAILSAKWKAREKYYEAVGGYKGELDKILTSHLEKFLAEIPKDGDEAATQKLCDLYDDMNKSATTNPYCAEFKKKVESCMDEIIQKGIKNNTDCKNIIAKEKFLPHGTLDPLKNIDLTISKFSEYNNDSNFNGKKVTFLPDRSNQFKNAWKSYRTFHERILEEMPELHKSIKEKLNSEDASTSGGAPGDGGASTSGGAPGDGGASTSGGAPGDGGASTSGGAPGDGGTPDGREGTSGDGDPFTHPKEL